MALPISFANTVFQAGFVGTDDGGPSAGFGIDDVSTNPLTVNGTVKAVGDPITVSGILPGQTTASTTTFYATQFDSASSVQFNSNATGPYTRTDTRLVLSNTSLPDGSRFTSDGDTTLNSYAAPVCFTSGTRIRTVNGDVAVENLSIGDRVVTSSGEERPIRWLGHRTIDCSRHDRPADVLPVRVAAGAFAENRPSRDLLVSPGHSLCFDVVGEVLVAASALVNGTTITQDAVETVTYWHVELDSHDILIANDQPAESYLDMGNREFFSESTLVRLDGVPDTDAAQRTTADFCRPFHGSGVIVEAVRTRVQARVVQIGKSVSPDAPKLHYADQVPGPLVGHLDGCVDGILAGWAYDSKHPALTVRLDVVVDGVVVGSVDADADRPDVRAAGFGSGRSGFQVMLPSHLGNGDDHEIELRRSFDGMSLGVIAAKSRLAA